MARRKKKRGGGGRKQIRIIPIAGAATSAFSVYSTVSPHWGTDAFPQVMSEALTGYNPAVGWVPATAMKTYGPVGAAIGISYIGRKLGLNRHIPLPKGIQLF
jgi:hypothetical protein